MKKALILIVLLLVVFLGEILMFDNNSHAQDDKPLIVVTSYPLYEISNKLIGQNIDVMKLIPYGVEAHSYTPSVKTMRSILKADLFIYIGLGMEPWVNKDYSNAIDMSKHVRFNEGFSSHAHAHSHNENVDPHYWLDINNMILMTKTILDKLKIDFPEYKVLLEENAKKYIEELRALDAKYTQTLSSCKRDEIVVNHNAFGYLATKYHFEVHSLTGVSPDEQVSAKNLKEMTDLVKDEDIKIIFFESFVSDKLAHTISKETGALVKSLQPLANVTKEEANKGYITIMQDNLKKISLAMECK